MTTLLRMTYTNTFCYYCSERGCEKEGAVFIRVGLTSKAMWRHLLKEIVSILVMWDWFNICTKFGLHRVY